MVMRLDVAEVRQYLLGALDDRGQTTLEERYLENPDTLEEVAAIEDDLIEEYLAGRLDSNERRQFEQHYLSTPRHRARVDTMRRLLAHATRTAASSSSASNDAARSIQQRPWRAWLAAAAALAIVAGGTMWLYRASAPKPSAPAAAGNQPPAAAAPAQGNAPATVPRRVFAFSLPAVSVRSGNDSPSLVIPAGVDVVSLDLKRDDRTSRPATASVVIRTIGGDEVFSGPASVAADLPPDVAARAEVPAVRLPADDYTVTLVPGDRSYFLRVR